MKTNYKSPECAGGNLYETFTRSDGGYGRSLLPGLGTWFVSAKFRVVLCGDCGLTRYYAEPAALAKLPNASQWRHL